jgi:hypothetical protein
MEGTDAMATVGSANWVKETIRSWRHSIWVGVYDPWPVVKGTVLRVSQIPPPCLPIQG